MSEKGYMRKPNNYTSPDLRNCRRVPYAFIFKTDVAIKVGFKNER